MKATPDLVAMYERLFVNRLAYTRQSDRPHPENGCHYYFVPKRRATRESLSLTSDTIRRHLEGKITIGLFSINPRTQRSKWVVFDADYADAMRDLRRLQSSLLEDDIETGLETSRRGGHLWMFMDKPLLARECLIYVYNLIVRLQIPVRSTKREGGRSKQVEGVEVFPRRGEVPEGGFGNAIRGPLGIHRGAHRRFWFEGAAETLGSQIAYLNGLHKLSEAKLASLIAGKTLPAEFAGRPAIPIESLRFRQGANVFRILEHVGRVRRFGTEYVAQCPSCASDGRDRHRDNLHVSVANPLKYCCRAGCSADMIRAAIGCRRRSA